MDVTIHVPELGITAKRAEIVDNNTDVVNMLMTIYVELFSQSGDRIKVIPVEHKLSGFPIPSLQEQWEIVMPVLEAMR